MGVVAVAAGDAAGVHPALQERAEDEGLFADLAVEVVEAVAGQFKSVGVVEALAHGLVGERRPEGVATAAHVGVSRTGGPVRGRNGLPGRKTPEDTRCRAVRETGVWQCACRVVACQPDVATAGAVASLAGHVHFAVGRGRDTVARTFAYVRRMARGALAGPVERVAGPVEWMVRVDVFVRLQVEPTLPTLVGRPGVPGDAERLQPPVAGVDQVLLQRPMSEGVANGEAAAIAGAAAGVDVE